MIKDEYFESLAEIIKDYRKGELDFNLDSQHIKKWLSQFSEDAQETILLETIHIFKDWYFSYEEINKILNNAIEFIQNKYSFTDVNELIDNMSILEVQEKGDSQHTLISIINENIQQRYGLTFTKGIDFKTSHYLYIDDGLYTGSRAKKDLEKCIEMLPNNSTLDIFYIVAGQIGLNYTKSKIKEIATTKNIEVSFYRWKRLQNDKHYTPQICLWPESNLKNIPEISTFKEETETLYKKFEIYPYRTKDWKSDKGIFTSVENRNIVEKEFLLQGIKITNSISENKGIYPLGYNLWPSFGFGAFCAFDMNISNNCPLVLWWGNNHEKGDILDGWYPLLPRRINRENNVEIEDWEDFENAIYKEDQYNMCPDCGLKFGIDTDGGNGFCIDCAWNH